MPAQDHNHKSIIEGLMRDASPRDLLLVYGGIEAVLTISMIHYVICNKWVINPEYKKVLN